MYAQFLELKNMFIEKLPDWSNKLRQEHKKRP